MKSTILLCVALALAGVGTGQEKPKDVDGYGKVKWGMTVAELRAAYNLPAGSLSIGPVKVGDIEMDADVDAPKRGSDKITRVELTWIFFGHPEGPSGRSGFDMIKTLLTQKYGAPASDEVKRETGWRDVLWTFPSTSIVLRLTNVAVTVDYRASDKKALDAL